MSFKKKMLAVAAAGALTAATAVPAMALENEFHGMYRAFGFATNAETGGGSFNLNKNAKDTFFAEQRARLMYIAKANDNLKLVTHFELDSRFGGQSTPAGASNKYPIGDAGNLDADRINIETKDIYLDFNIPQCQANVKAGIQPWTDSYQGVFASMDAAGAYTSGKIGAFTPSLGWFRFADNNYVAPTAPGNEIMPGKQTADMFVIDGKFAVSKDLVIGASYYNVQNDQGAATAVTSTTGYDLLHMIGVSASANVGPAAVNGFFAYQFGDFNDNRELGAYGAGATAKVAVGPGKLNLAALYLSGESTPGAATGDYKAFRQLASSGTVSYFNPANMWLLVRNGAMINSSTAIGGTDLTKGSRGFLGFFGGYELTKGNVIANANVGYGMVDEKQGASSDVIGTEINATVGYKLYDNLTASLTGAYLILGDFSSPGSVGTGTAAAVAGLRSVDADNPYLAALQLSYTF